MAINTPSPSWSATGSAGETAGSTTQLGQLVQAMETLTIAQTKAVAGQKTFEARLLALEQQRQFLPAPVTARSL